MGIEFADLLRDGGWMIGSRAEWLAVWGVWRVTITLGVHHGQCRAVTAVAEAQVWRQL